MCSISDAGISLALSFISLSKYLSALIIGESSVASNTEPIPPLSSTIVICFTGKLCN